MENVSIDPQGIVVLCVVLLVGVGWFVLAKFVYKPSPFEYNAFYTTEPKFQEPPGCEIRLLGDRLTVNFGPNPDKKSFDILYANINAFGKEPGILFDRSFFVSLEDRVEHFALGRTKQLALELNSKIVEYKKMRKAST